MQLSAGQRVVICCRVQIALTWRNVSRTPETCLLELGSALATSAKCRQPSSRYQEPSLLRSLSADPTTALEEGEFKCAELDTTSPLLQHYFSTRATRFRTLGAGTSSEDAMAMHLGDDAVPGTVKLLDLEHNMAARHAGDGEIILIPTPSDDPDDPLNWSPRRKTMSTICVNL